MYVKTALYGKGRKLSLIHMRAEYYVTLTQELYIRFQDDTNVKIKLIFYCITYNGIGLSLTTTAQYKRYSGKYTYFFPFKLT